MGIKQLNTQSSMTLNEGGCRMPTDNPTDHRTRGGVPPPPKGRRRTTPCPIKYQADQEQTDHNDGQPQQLELEFTPQKETRAERCKRLLSGDLGHVVKPASELMFDYDKATAIATRRQK